MRGRHALSPAALVRVRTNPPPSSLPPPPPSRRRRLPAGNAPTGARRPRSPPPRAPPPHANGRISSIPCQPPAARPPARRPHPSGPPAAPHHGEPDRSAAQGQTEEESVPHTRNPGDNTDPSRPAAIQTASAPAFPRRFITAERACIREPQPRP